MEPSGNLFFEDEYGTQYQSTWQTVGGALDITTISRTPYVWGEQNRGYYENKVLFRYGIITTHRQVIQSTDDGYVIIAEGAEQITDYFQTTFACGSGPTDPFTYHINCSVSDQVEMLAVEGPHWTDPDNEDDMDSIWPLIEADGSIDGDTTATGGVDIFEWMDVWE